MPTQAEIDEALRDYDLWDSNGFAAVSQDQIEIAIVTLVAAYRAEKARADNLQKQVDRIATLHVKNRFGFDPFDNGRPLV